MTSKLEGLFNSVKGIKEISSVSEKDYGSINLSFKKDANIDAVRFEIASLIRQSYCEFSEQLLTPELSLVASGKMTAQFYIAP